MVWGDTFIETFTGGRIKDYLSESADDYLNDKKLSERYKTIQLPKECFIFNNKELKHHNVTATYAIQKVIRRSQTHNNQNKDDTSEATVEIPMSPRLFPNYPTSTPVYANVYIVPDIKSGSLTFYDLRLSYSSSTPAQFNMDVFNIKKFETFFSSQLSNCCKKCQNFDMDKALIIMITANYDGVTTNEPTTQSLTVPYNIVFEPYLFLFIPKNVIPLMIFMGVLSAFLVVIFIPRVFQHIDHLKQE
jgi:protein gp37